MRHQGAPTVDQLVQEQQEDHQQHVLAEMLRRADTQARIARMFQIRPQGWSEGIKQRSQEEVRNYPPLKAYYARKGIGTSTL